MRDHVAFEILQQSELLADGITQLRVEHRGAVIFCAVVAAVHPQCAASASC